MAGPVQILIAILVILSPLLCSSEKAIPLVAWSNTRSLADTPRISAGKLITREELGTSYMDNILQTQPQNIFLFVFDELSIGDISKYSDAYRPDGHGGALSNLKKAMEESSSHLVLPTVESSDLQADLSSKVTGATIDLKEPTLEGVTLDLAKTNLIVKRFAVGSSADKEEAFARADGIMKSIVEDQKMRSVRFTAILTAERKTQLEPAPSDRLTVGRRLLQDPTPEFVANFKKDPCNVYVTAAAIGVSITKSGKPVPLPVQASDWKINGTCTDENSVTLVATLSKSVAQGPDSFSMSLSFTKDFQYWILASTSFVTMETDGNPQKYDLVTSIDESPTTFSYHCSNSVFRLVPQGGGKETRQLVFTELQIQPFQITAKEGVDQFGPANDCVGFFTEGIWMGLFMGLIIVLIFSFGIGMLANLKVMDKFDDPKGKTISVNTGE
ncbi:V-type proton ATPase subunit S1-like [Asterias rubens]|uniref:V-type proton ATPase subunit S1-like n=1 Tax=Asterias rubens TaxID=7604 RepID=UPI00145594C1|nr:V-type proton ATPase subunit S1-like [Asterias rubens]